ncbi:SRPBCC domain-containing protein [Kitasatospora sp. A2-31]|uniref:SRPBCC domain-containing protein n=1 Tax=Kitasatospora sp. A2-31 TaxID=2916414 RepID=UPI001EEA9484|nr:SRPBCC domain-containing protein [Kitasatospora sp. A2-31]MCG6497844.1 SRPBCC domain-containing protein [Kitasatospora sp. A2-31]
MTVPAVRHTVYLHATPEHVWHALTNADESGVYWGHRNVSTWLPGAAWEHRRTDDSGIADVVGTVVEVERPHRLVTTWAGPDEHRPGGPSRVTFRLQGHRDLTRLVVTHENLADEREQAEAEAGWSAVLSNLKTYLETGRPLPQEPWLMP